MRSCGLLASGLLIFSAVFSGPPALAQTPDAADPPTPQEAEKNSAPEVQSPVRFGKQPTPLPDSFGVSTSLVEVTLNLGVVLAAIVLLAWIVKRVQGMDHPSTGMLRVAATLPLGPKERLLVVEVGNQQLLLGATQAGINTLHVLEERMTMPSQVDESFRDRLLKSLKGANA